MTEKFAYVAKNHYISVGKERREIPLKPFDRKICSLSINLNPLRYVKPFSILLIGGATEQLP